MRALLAAVALALLAAAPAHAGDVARVAPPTEISGLLAGPEGGAWVVSRDFAGRSVVGRANADGGYRRVTENEILGSGAVGPDGAAYFVADGTILVRVDAAGAVTSQRVVKDASHLLGFGLAAGGDGRLWTTTLSSPVLARITLDGQATYTELKLPKCHEALLVSALANAGDGSVWIADHECQQLIRIAADGRQTVVAVPEMVPGTIAGDAAGGAWFVDLSGFGGHVDAAGQVSRVDPGNGVATGVAVAADGAAWFASGTCTLFRAAPDGTLTTEPAAVPAQTLAFDPAGGLWQASRTRLVHDSSSTPCDDTPPRIALSAHGHVSLAALRRGLTLTVEPGAYVRWTEAFDHHIGSGPSRERRLASTGSVRVRTAALPLLRLRRALAAGQRPRLRLMVDAADRDGNESYKNFSLLVTR